MIYVKNQIESRLVIEKSIFIGILYPINSTDEIPAILKSIKLRYPKANHYPSAYVIYQSVITQGSNDDNEPSSTAGVPILEILNQRKLVNVYMVVVRYFGGIKLGASGLIRAYANATLEAVNQASLYKIIKAPTYKALFEYGLLNTLEQKLANNVIYQDKTFTDKVEYIITCLNDSEQELLDLKHHFIKLEKLADTDVEVAI